MKNLENRRNQILDGLQETDKRIAEYKQGITQLENRKLELVGAIKMLNELLDSEQETNETEGE